MYPVRCILLAAVFVARGPSVLAETRPINVADSTLTVFVYKSGLFSAFADNHIVKAPIASGTMSDEAPLSVELTVHAADLRVLDPELGADKRADVQARMLGADVLDVAKYPDITFASSAIEPVGPDRWTVRGRLTIHGQTRPITFPVARTSGRYRGEVAIKQRDFGIEPIRIAGGAVKVKDEVRIQFDISRGSPAGSPDRSTLSSVRGRLDRCGSTTDRCGTPGIVPRTRMPRDRRPDGTSSATSSSGRRIPHSAGM